MNEGISETEHTVTLEQALEAMLLTDLREVDADVRDRLRRFQELGRAALAAEALRAQPRDVGAVLLEAFGGPHLRDALREAEPAGLVQAANHEGDRRSRGPATAPS
jgi:hypothetical protein